MWFRVLDAFFAALFAFSALVQFNDPDPALWVIVYGMAAILCGVAWRGLLTPRVAWLYVGVAALVAVRALTGEEGEVHMGWGPAWGPLARETVREALGMVLVAGWMTVLALRAGRERPATEEPAE